MVYYQFFKNHDKSEFIYKTEIFILSHFLYTCKDINVKKLLI